MPAALAQQKLHKNCSKSLLGEGDVIKSKVKGADPLGSQVNSGAELSQPYPSVQAALPSAWLKRSFAESPAGSITAVGGMEPPVCGCCAGLGLFCVFCTLVCAKVEALTPPLT